jgi:hypothetical protein
MTDQSATSRDTLGQAVRDAKERYLAGTLVLTPYDEKILQSWTYYGLPMYTLGDIVDPNDEAATTTETRTFLELAGATTLLASTPLIDGPASFATDNGTTTVEIDLSGDALEKVDVAGPPASSYYRVDGNAIVAQYRPVQPLVDVEIPVSGTYQGFLVTGLTTQDLPDSYVPFSSNPLIDNSLNETRVVVGDGAFPATLQRVNDVTDGQRLLVAAGEYESGQRLFRRISGELIPRTKTGDDVAARFVDVVGRRVADVGLGGEGVQFDVVTERDAVRAVVLYREFGDTLWRSLELAGRPVGADGTRSWFGSAPLLGSGDDVEFFVQNVDDAGNVGISRNKIENFSTSDADDPDAAVGIDYTGDPAKEFDGRYYASGAVFEIVGGTVDTLFSIDSGPLREYNPTEKLTIQYVEGATGTYDPDTGELEIDRGPHVLFADEDGSRVYRFFILDPDAPTVEVFPSTTDWTKSPVTVTITATDSGAGVRSIGYDCGAVTCEDITPADAEATIKVISVSAEGVTTISATATDNVSNGSAPSTAEVRIDTTAPQVQVVPATTEWSATPVDVTITATDARSGVGSITFDCGTGTCTEISDEPDAGTGTARKVVRVSGEGITTVSATATDNAGNGSVAPSTAEVRVDLTDPTITSFSVTPDGDGIYALGEAVTATFACSDEQSGLASCELFDGTTRVAVGSPYTIDTSTPGTHRLTVTATDLVDRTTTSEVITVTVAYGICLLYDPTLEKNIGSNYTIKLRLCDSQGRNLSARNITLTALTVDQSDDPGPNFSGKANDGYEFRYNATDASYIYNLDTTRLDAGSHLLYFTTRPVPKPRPTDPNVLNSYVDAAPAPFALR